jgi:PPOX class probable F420-dependent enzyme
MSPNIATNDQVDLSGLLDFVRSRHRMVLVTSRADGRPQLSPVTGGVDGGAIVVSSYPQRAKVANLRKRAGASVMVQSDEFNDAWVQVDGTAEILEGDEGVEALVGYFRSIAGEHSDWDEYREAMRRQAKVLIRITPERWGPVATGGFPPEVAAEM